MLYFRRALEEQLFATASRNKVRLLLGARQTGKTSLLAEALPREATHVVNLAVPAVRRRYELDPGALGRELAALPARVGHVVIDEVQKVLTDDEIADLQRGVKLEDGMTSPAMVKKIKKAEANSWVEITIHEGRKHQVKRMLETVGHPVIKLTRVKMGPLTLGGLTSGEFRFLTDREANALREVVEQRRTLEQEGKDPGVRPPRPKRRAGGAKPVNTKRCSPKKARRVA